MHADPLFGFWAEEMAFLNVAMPLRIAAALLRLAIDSWLAGCKKAPASLTLPSSAWPVTRWSMGGQRALLAPNAPDERNLAAMQRA